MTGHTGRGGNALAFIATAVTGSHRHRLGDALRAVKVFAGAAFDVIVLGQYGEEVGVVRRHK
ncbi:hypothetical protein [Streptomyces tibetensis]|uniref:hypothetical protein n=1 Tax=Streptomyces tibetensis TaxID=2382123 RepID=UPI003F4D6143